MSARIAAAGVGVEFRFDRQRRPVSPRLSRLRRSGSRSWGLRDIDLEIGPGEADPTILLLDEVHEALDHDYRAFVRERAIQILAAGEIVIAAGHDHPLLEQLSTRALWLDHGRIVEDGPFGEVCKAYLASSPEPE